MACAIVWANGKNSEMKPLQRFLATICAATIIVGAIGCARPLPVPPMAKSPQNWDATLVAAVKLRDVAQVKALLSRGADANARDDSARAAWRKLMAETATGQDPQSGKTITITRGQHAPPTYSGPTALMIACYNADHATMRALLDSGAKIEARGVEVGAARAAQKGDWNIDVETHVTPFIEAMMSGDVAAMRLLLQRGANVNAPDSSGLTPVGWANNMTPTSEPTPERRAFLDRIFGVLKAAKARGLRE